MYFELVSWQASLPWYDSQVCMCAMHMHVGYCLLKVGVCNYDILRLSQF